ncbi:multicopper oxidase family protein [Petropleomorpha daqingensis]|uniref:FtsP/CotA-like multicopper oxidase with cupredoxin domain n=1 Tax=Petropleomorpha daqingensis TaxID=2026353 RepID=A0A853CMI8_9ACTN|nr:FtsP/CotA-like multicopper oxidase with cupredoxin domain [Petropleomorpha daqingensis]
MRRRLRVLLSAGAALAVLGPLGWFWQDSLLPGTYSVMDMGYVDTGGGAAESHAHGDGGIDLRTLTADPDRPADVSVTLIARQERFRLASGRTVAGYTLNGSSPGPTIRATVGDLVEVRLVNISVPDGVTIHWHGVDVPGAEDGVAGVTQDAVAPGAEYVYRFVADRAGTYWYHSHQRSAEQVAGGLLGALVVDPAPVADPAADVLALVHHYGGVATVNGREGDVLVPAVPGSTVRVRVIDTDNGPMWVWVGGGRYQVAAVDGTDVHEPGQVSDRALLVPAGGRADVLVTLPDDGSPLRVHLGGRTGIVLSSSGRAPAVVARPAQALDLLSYGAPAALGFDPDAPDRRFDYDIGRRPGFLDGRPGLWWTVNGHAYPDVPMFVVREGDVVLVRIVNASGERHPMHLHGHHAVVLSRDGVRATGSPWWVDSLDVADGETYEIAFVADNPGVWVDHCHNLPHAEQGLIVHLAYAGVSTPFVIGGPAGNVPE